MRKLFAVLAIMLLALPAFAADTIKIGEIATVTGDFAAYGVAEDGCQRDQRKGRSSR